MELRLFIPINPKAKQSFRFTKTGMKFQPADVIEYKNTLQSIIINQLPKGFVPFETGLYVIYHFKYPYPKNLSKKKKASLIEKFGKIFRSKKQDLDNLQKAVNDAMNGIVFKDDSLICVANSFKYYSDKPGTSIIISEVENYI